MEASGSLPRASMPATSTILTAAMDERIGFKLSNSKLDMMRSLQPSQTRQQSNARESLKSRAEQSSDGTIITISVRKTYLALPIDPCKDVYSVFPSVLLSTLNCSSSDETHRLTPRMAPPHPQPARPLLQANLELNLGSFRTKVLKPQSPPVAQKKEAVSYERRRLMAITLRHRPSTFQVLKPEEPTPRARWGMNEDTTISTASRQYHPRIQRSARRRRNMVKEAAAGYQVDFETKSG